jgi:hypothetical protein
MTPAEKPCQGAIKAHRGTLSPKVVSLRGRRKTHYRQFLDFQIQFRITLAESTAYGSLGFAQRKEERKKVKIAPFRLRSTPQIFQLIYAALFCAAISRSIKGRCKGGTRSPGPGIVLNSPPCKTRQPATEVYVNPALLKLLHKQQPSCRSGTGEGGLILTPPFPRIFRNSIITAAQALPVF